MGRMLKKKVLRYMGECIDAYIDLYEVSLLDISIDPKKVEKAIEELRKFTKDLKDGKEKDYLEPEIVDLQKDFLEAQAGEKKVDIFD